MGMQIGDINTVWNKDLNMGGQWNIVLYNILTVMNLKILWGGKRVVLLTKMMLFV